VWVNALALVVSVLVSWRAALHFGLAGAAAGGVIAVCLDRVLLLRHISASSGVPLAQLQDWRRLARIIAFSALAALAAWGTVVTFLEHAAPVLRLTLGGAVLAALYGGIYLRGRSG
jgi:peptidoglycan biosynthesis protein MviN/MurJ (putative lipid II flippase)